MADVVFVMHRAMVVSAATATKGAAYPTRFGEAKDSAAPFSIRVADEAEANAAAEKLKHDVDRRVAHLQMEAKIAARVAELRREGYRGDR